MATIRPFRALRPRGDLGEKIAALPYDVMNTDEARKMAAGNPYSFLHIDRSEIDLPPDTDPYDDKVYEKARDNLRRFEEKGWLFQDSVPCLYIYRLVLDGRAQTGVAAAVSVDEYESGIIKKHEKTRADKEEDRIKHVDITDAHTGPIFMAYRHSPEISAIVENFMEKNEPVYDFTTSDGVGHTVWKIDDPSAVGALAESFKNIPNLYIADGHHRNASAAKVCLRRRAEHPDFTGYEGYNFYLAVLFPDDQLKILDYNRVVKDLAGKTDEEFLGEIKDEFNVFPAADKFDAKPKKPGDFGMYLSGAWYRLEAKRPVGNDPIDSLDVSILQDRLLVPILGIGDIRTDRRIDFIGGIRGLGELEKRVDSGEMRVAFSMYPTSMQQLFRVADSGMIMPPKSTWFEPKLRSGLLIHKLDD